MAVAVGCSLTQGPFSTQRVAAVGCNLMQAQEESQGPVRAAARKQTRSHRLLELGYPCEADSLSLLRVEDLGLRVEG
jgi:hypothetical protein